MALVPECVSGLSMPGVTYARLRGLRLRSALLVVHRTGETAPAVRRVLEGVGRDVFQ
ncbi:hypothetical protein BJ968_004747 [Kineococcus aurantiacus]|uniref:LysR substrate binding domain-containing protein n=1 Tax=Kineococcus aurantiacus TaxID=37633 RepID=A0A7Y9DR37_9ACTN|nr:hypothetical protein [Kineococcus aurantiacus]